MEDNNSINSKQSNPRPNLPSLLEAPSSTQHDSNQGGIRLPPISFLNNITQIPGQQVKIARLLSESQNEPSPVQPPQPQLSVKSPLPAPAQFNFGSHAQSPGALALKEEITKPDIDSERDEEIIKYYEQKYGITDFTTEEKHDILQHERRARIEKQKNPNYKTYLCYSIIKRLNAVKPSKPEREKAKPEVAVKEENKSNADETIVEKVTEPKPEQAESKPEPKPKPVVIRKSVKQEIIVNNNNVLDFASKFPRKHLGSLLYTPYPTRESYRQLTLFKDLSAEPNDTRLVPLLPELREHINSIITVRIPSWFITDLKNNKHYQERSIWGCDVYTDDSDILLILKHNGFLPSVDEEIEGDEKMEKQTPGNRENKANISQSVTNFRQFVNIIGGDIHVDLIVLPPLVEYSGVYRNGINTRPWKAHDGMSIAIHGVRYGEKGSAVDSVNNVEVKKRRLQELEELKNSEGDTWKLDKDAWKRAKADLDK
jgi:hypothetical protein